MEQIVSGIFWPIVGPRSPNLVIGHRDWSIPGLVALFLRFLVKFVGMNLLKKTELLTKWL